MPARWAFAAVIGGALTLLGGVAVAQEHVETTGVAPFPPGTPERLWVFDLAFNHMVDGRVDIVDPKGRRLSRPALDRLHRLRGVRARRQQVLQRHDLLRAAVARHQARRAGDVRCEDPGARWRIELPTKRASVITYKDMLSVTSDGRFALVQNATPASSVTVVDLPAKKVASEVDTAGCWSAVPSTTDPRRFVTVCGDGTLEPSSWTTAASRSRGQSERLFDPDNDPIFIQSEAIGDVHYWVSFKGKLVSADVSAATPKILEPWDFTGGVDGGWRPGGYNPLAAHVSSKRLFVGMHSKGTEGSHKNPAEEIWALDLATKKVAARGNGHNALAVNVTQTDHPLVYALEGGTGVVALDADNGLADVTKMENIAETATYAIVR